MTSNKLFIVHCGFYDSEIYNGKYEFHVNIPIIAADESAAKVQIKKCPKFQARKMHIDGIHEINFVELDNLKYQIQVSNGESI